MTHEDKKIKNQPNKRKTNHNHLTTQDFIEMENVLLANSSPKRTYENIKNVIYEDESTQKKLQKIAKILNLNPKQQPTQTIETQTDSLLN